MEVGIVSGVIVRPGGRKQRAGREVACSVSVGVGMWRTLVLDISACMLGMDVGQLGASGTTMREALSLALSRQGRNVLPRPRVCVCAQSFMYVCGCMRKHSSAGIHRRLSLCVSVNISMCLCVAVYLFICTIVALPLFPPFDVRGGGGRREVDWVGRTAPGPSVLASLFHEVEFQAQKKQRQPSPSPQKTQ